MNTDVNQVLYSLETKIFRGFLAVVLGLTATIIMLLCAVYYTGGITPKLLERNYDSITYAANMKRAVSNLTLATSRQTIVSPFDVNSFNSNLKSAESNVTEPGEKEIIQTISSFWDNFQTKLFSDARLADDLNHSLDSLIAVNEKGMFALADQARSLRLTVLASGIGLTVIALLYSLLFAGNASRGIRMQIQKILLEVEHLNAPIINRDTAQYKAKEIEKFAQEISHLLS